MTQPPPPPSRLNPEIGPELESVLLKALHKSPEERYQSGSDLIRALERAIRMDESAYDSSASLASNVSSMTPTRPVPLRIPAGGLAYSLRRKPGLLAVAALALLGITLTRVYSNSSRIFSLPLTQAPNIPTQSSPGIEQTRLLTTATPTAQLAADDIDPETLTTTPSPTELPTLVSATPVPPDPSPMPASPTPSPGPDPTATVLYPGGYVVTLFYHEQGFYLWNPGQRRVATSPLAFEALDAATGLAAGFRFDGWRWSEMFPFVERGKCSIVEDVRFSSPAIRPAQCLNGYSALRTPEGTSSLIFWITRPGVSQFRVLWREEEIASCEIEAGVCEVFLPP